MKDVHAVELVHGLEHLEKVTSDPVLLHALPLLSVLFEEVEEIASSSELHDDAQ